MASVAAFPTTYQETAGGPWLRLPNPSRPLSESLKMPAVTYTADSGKTQRRQQGNAVRVFSCDYIALTAKQVLAIENHFISACGQVYSFSWTHPVTKQPYTVRYQGDTLEKKLIEHSPKGPIYTLSFKLEQTW